MSDETFNVCCPGCRESVTLSQANVGDYVCPSCGLWIAAGSSDEPKDSVGQSSMDAAYAEQLEASRTFQETPGLLRVDFRVFRLGTFSTWETLFEEATDFANSLAPEALINISHSGGQAANSNAATVWYWRKYPVGEEGG